MKNKRNVLYGLAIIMVGLIYFPVLAQQKSGTHRASFSGEWRSKESIAMGGNIVCTYNPGDRMLATTMKITEQANFLTVEVSSSFPGAAPVSGVEKLSFDGKKSIINNGPGIGKEFMVKLSSNGKTMTINSIVHLMAVEPYHIKVQKPQIVYVDEVWTLSNDGRSITVLTKAKATLFSDERSWKTVFEKVG